MSGDGPRGSVEFASLVFRRARRPPPFPSGTGDDGSDAPASVRIAWERTYPACTKRSTPVLSGAKPSCAGGRFGCGRVRRNLCAGRRICSWPDHVLSRLSTPTPLRLLVQKTAGVPPDSRERAAACPSTGSASAASLTVVSRRPVSRPTSRPGPSRSPVAAVATGWRNRRLDLSLSTPTLGPPGSSSSARCRTPSSMGTGSPPLTHWR